MEISDIINQLGEERNLYFNSVAPPVMQSSNFCFGSVEEMRANIHREFDVPFYTRGNNPTVQMLRKKIAALEHADDALITSSGCAAITAAVVSNVSSGDHVICVKNCYSWTHTLLSVILARFGVQSTFVDGCNIENFKNAIRPETRLIYLESPTSFLFELQDIKAIAELAASHKIITVIDNSYATPLFQNPISLGIDIVIHSASKYLGGHSDLVAGVICSNTDMIKKIFATEYMTFGGIISPENAWLMLRGLRTLPLRMQQAASTAKILTEFLEKHPKVSKVFHPFSESHPQFELALKQMKNASSLFSVILKTDEIEKIDLFCNSLKRFLLACSWGGHESLVFPASVLYSSNNNNKTNLPINLVRIYAGLEEPQLLIEDLDRALDAI
ncbi:MAG: aminotransferase class I/II-fold pyridoxal phosphate-dependent enzyme [Bacteroidota bacterium]